MELGESEREKTSSQVPTFTGNKAFFLQQGYYLSVPDIFSIRALTAAAKNAPEILCQILNIVPGKAAATPKNCRESAAAKPEFCIPTSMAIVILVR